MEISAVKVLSPDPVTKIVYFPTQFKEIDLIPLPCDFVSTQS